MDHFHYLIHLNFLIIILIIIKNINQFLHHLMKNLIGINLDQYKYIVHHNHLLLIQIKQQLLVLVIYLEGKIKIHLFE